MEIQRVHYSKGDVPKGIVQLGTGASELIIQGRYTRKPELPRYRKLETGQVNFFFVWGEEDHTCMEMVHQARRLKLKPAGPRHLLAFGAVYKMRMWRSIVAPLSFRRGSGLSLVMAGDEHDAWLETVPRQEKLSPANVMFLFYHHV